MNIKKDKVVIENEIKSDMPQFDRGRLIEYTKGVILNLYNSIKENNLNNINVRISKEFLNKMITDRELYRISSDFDNISIIYVDLYDYVKDEQFNYVKVYASITFFDNVSNNQDKSVYNINSDQKFWNDGWIITYKAISDSDNNCRNCGSEMEYNKIKDAFECKFCRSIFPRDSKDWKVVNIEIEK